MKILENPELSLRKFRDWIVPYVPWCPRSILLSEAFAFCAMCDTVRLDAVIESGICNGRSTEIWARYMHPMPVTAFDWELTEAARERLKPWANVQLIKGDAAELLVPSIQSARHMTQHAKRAIGIFIDGPKGDEALAIAQRCLEYPQVMFVGVHDMARLINGKPRASRQKCEALPYKKWFTDAEWFIELAADLDADESHWDEEQGTRWTPGHRSERHSEPVPLGSYGYTIGFLVNA